MQPKQNVANTGYDPVWDDIYDGGHEQKAPWDSVVSFVYRNKPKDRENKDIRLLEVGCGTASNLRFFAKEEFDVSGIDASKTAIACAQKYFDENGLNGDLQVGSFDTLNYQDESFDLVIDRAALTHVGLSVQQAAVAEIHRVLKLSGKFLYTPYADTHTSYKSGEVYQDGLVKNIGDGTLQNVGHMCFMSREKIEELFPQDKWRFISMEYEERRDMMSQDEKLHSSWKVVAEKI